MSEPDSYLIWENENFTIQTSSNPHIPYSEGLHLFVAPKHKIANAWEDVELSSKTFKLASEACAVMKNLELAPWFNIQANGNWGLLPGSTPFFHIHIYGRNKTETWGKALVIPELPNTYDNAPMPAKDRSTLTQSFNELLV
jgi:diadenosine tetraphosphate (Ap4A) HIT family hydrolase